MRILLLFVFIMTISGLLAQNPCNDPDATNFQENGDCIYASKKLKLKNKQKLPAAVEENSGLLMFKNGVWTHNDSGGKPEIYKLDPETGNIIQVVKITNATNTDWEDMTQDANHIYIGDFGNNRGDRKDLHILKIKKEAIGESDTVNLKAEKILFSYPNQTTFGNAYNHNFDCEGFFFHNRNLHLFTKNWNNNKTYHYTVPAIPGDYFAILQDSLDVQGLITAADRSTDGTVLLLGYAKKGKVFMWQCRDYFGIQYFSGFNRKFKVGSSIFKGQAEGLTFIEGEKGIMSSEAFMWGKQKMYWFELDPKPTAKE